MCRDAHSATRFGVTATPSVVRTVPFLPGRALVIAPTIERAAAFATGFDDVVAATPDELGDVLATECHDLTVIGIAGFPARGGQLADIVRHVLDSCPSDVEIVLDVAGSLQTQLGDSREALRGLSVIEALAIGGIPCLRFAPAPLRESIPDVSALLAAADVPAVPDASMLELRAEIAHLRSALAAAQAQLPAEGSAAPAAPGPAGNGAFSRGGRLLLASAGAVILVAALVLLVTDATYVEVAASAVGGLVLLQLVYGWRGVERGRVNTAKLGQEVFTVRQQIVELQRVLSSLNSRLQQMENNVAIVTATSADTAHAVASVQDRLRGEFPTLPS